MAMCAAPAFAEPGFSATHSLPNDVGSLVAEAQPYSNFSCVSPGNCTAVGPLDSGAGNTDATVTTETDGAWGAAATVPLPANADTAAADNEQSLNDVACWSVGDCAAVGDYTVSVDVGGENTPLSEPMIVVETSGVWGTASELQITSPDVVSGSALVVSCDGEGDCTAAGYFDEINPSTFDTTNDEFTTTQPLGSSTWSPPAELTSPVASSDLVVPTSISCLDAMNCTLTEEAIGATAATAYLETENSGVWGAATTIARVGTRRVGFSEVTCTATGDCVAVGFSSPTPADLLNQVDALPAVAIESAGVWGTPKDLALPLLSPVTDQGLLFGVSCFATGTCEAVGDALIGPANAYSVPIAVSLSGSSWSTIGIDQVPARAGKALATATELLAVSCDTSTSCAAMGVAQNGSFFQTTDEYGYVTSVYPSESLSVPGKPRSVKVASTTVRSTVSFDPPTTDGGARISLFTVTAKSKAEHTKICTTPGLSCSVSGLVKGHTYTVTVVAKNVKGESQPSTTYSFKAA
jgi:hypothetical protein